MRITKNELIEINLGQGGNLINSNSLDFAIQSANETGNIYKSCSFLIRALAVFHPFTDGNKRTAVFVCINELGDCGKEKLSRLIVKIAKNNIVEINKIEKMLRRCYQKN